MAASAGAFLSRRGASDPIRIGMVLKAMLGLAVPVVLLGLVVPPLVGLAAAILILLPWIWRSPVRGLYLLVAGAVMIEVFPLQYPDSMTDRIPFFLNLDNTARLPISATPAEIVMGVVILAWLAAAGRDWLPRGRLLAPYSIFMGLVLLSELVGLARGGNFTLSLWELRPQVYGFILFVLAGSLVRGKQDIQRLALVLAIGALLKAGIADWRYFVTIDRNVGYHEALLAHEDSYFLLLFLTVPLVTAIWCPNRRVLVATAAAAPLVLIALLANERRAGPVALIFAASTIAVLGVRFQSRRRWRVAVVGLVVAALLGIFLTVNWNTNSTGITGQFVRPFKSVVSPDPRDRSSDLYRQAEDANLKLTFASSPIIGVGFGHPYLTVYPQADISAFDPLWNIIPHNTLLWVGMRMGLIGWVAFWCLMGMAVWQVCRLLSTRRDPFQQAVAAFVAAALVAEIVLGDLDLQLESYRNMIFVGALLGVLNGLAEIRGDDDDL